MPARVLASGPQPPDPHSQGSLALLCHFAVPIAYVHSVPGPWPAPWQHPRPCELAGAVCVCLGGSPPHMHFTLQAPGTFPSHPLFARLPGLPESLARSWPWAPVALCCGFIYPTNYILATESGVNRFARCPSIRISGCSHPSLVRPALAHTLRDFYIKIMCLYHVGDWFFFSFLLTMPETILCIATVTS